MPESDDHALNEGKRRLIVLARAITQNSHFELDDASWPEDGFDGESLVLVLKRGASDVADWFSLEEVQQFASADTGASSTVEKVRKMVERL